MKLLLLLTIVYFIFNWFHQFDGLFATRTCFAQQTKWIARSKKEYFSLLSISGWSQNIGRKLRKVGSIWPEERRRRGSL